MPVVTFDDFAGGLDVRPAAAISKPNIVRSLVNAYITSGKAIRKRPCLYKEATLEAGTVGLKAFGGVLNTFYGDGVAVTHSDVRFVPRRLPHVTTGVAPTKIHYCDQYNALMYAVAEYADGTFRHHYLDGGSSASPAWVALTNYALGNFVVPTVANGFRYEVTTDAGAAAAAEPAWPLVVGSTVVDGGLTWTCRTFSITDANCPHTKQTTKQAEKIYAKRTTNVAYCKTGDPRDWTTASDAGFIPAGLYVKGSDEVTAIGPFQQSGLWIAFSDGSQVWTVDPSPAQNSLLDSIDGIGTRYHRAAGSVSRDLFFLAQNGFRSVSLITVSNNLQDNDVGSAIDKLVKAEIAASDDPLALYYPKLGQEWWINGTTAWVYTFSRTAKISAWSKFTFPFAISDATVLNQELYVRTGNDVYRASDVIYKDGAADIPLVDVQMFFQDGKRPGVLKQWTGVDTICTGQPTLSYLYAADNQTLESAAYELPAVSEPGVQYPVELMSTRIAPHVSHQKDEEFEISALSLYYENLGVV